MSSMWQLCPDLLGILLGRKSFLQSMRPKDMAGIYERSWLAQFFDLHHWTHTLYSLLCAHLLDAGCWSEMARMGSEHG